MKLPISREIITEESVECRDGKVELSSHLLLP